MKKRRMMILFFILVLVGLFFLSYWKWKNTQTKEETPCTTTINNHVVKKEQEEIVVPKNENYIEIQEEEREREMIPMEKNTIDYDWVKDYSQSFMRKFKIDHAHQSIFKILHEHFMTNQTRTMEEWEVVYVVISQCPTLSVAKKMELALYVIWKSTDQQPIDHVYEMIFTIASDEQENPKTRANALEILMRSNNKVYMERSKRIMDTLKEHEKIQEMEQIRQRMERIQNVMQQRAPMNPSTLRRQPPTPPPPTTLQGHVPLTAEEVQVQNILLDQYRRLERRAFNAMKHKTTVYDDTQNVHNHKINESVIQSVQHMMEQTPPPSSSMIHVEKELATYYPEYEKHREKIKSSLHRIQTDPSKFKGKTTVGQVFNRIIQIIANSRHKGEMWKRMGEELVEMNQLCATGHLSRIVNVIQGFEDIPAEFQIKMDPKDEIYANLSNYITMQVQNSGESDKLLESMIDPENRTLFIGFVCIILPPKLAEIRKEYGTMVESSHLTECIHASIRNYLKNEKDASQVIESLQQQPQ